MKGEVNPKLVGGVVLGALLVLATAVALFMWARLVDPRARAVIYFDGSVNGLTVGAPVALRGVKVGEVTDVRLRLDLQAHRVAIPVYIAFDRGRARVIGDDGRPAGVSIAEAVQRGLRAQLQMQSFVTGQLFVELNYQPDTPATLAGIDPATPEIPTAPTGLDNLMGMLAALPMREIAQTAAKVAASVDDLLASPELRQMLLNFTGSSAGLQAVLLDARPHAGSIRTSLDRASTAATGTIRDIRALAAALKTDVDATSAQVGRLKQLYDTQIDAVSGDMARTLQSIDKALRDADLALAGVNAVFGEGTSPRTDIDQIMRNLATTTRALRALAETLERNPTALVTGRR